MNIARAHGDLACGSYLVLVLVLVQVSGWLLQLAGRLYV
jgi:hypothetical protein